MFKKLRFIAVLMAVALLAGQIGTVNVNAAQGVEKAPIGTKLSGFRITDLDKSIAGHDLDFKARVRTNENVTWEIPVIWTDENGNTVYHATPGHTYYPNFAFFIPQGYAIDEKVLAGKTLVKLPDFLLELYGAGSVLFATDASLGITYITFEQAVSAQAAKNAREAAATSIAPATPAKSDSGKDDGGNNNPPAPAPGPVDPFSTTVRIHCSNDIMEKYKNSPKVLEEVVTLIKNKLQPQAVALLKNSFDAYKTAPLDALSNYIGLWIYNDGKEGVGGSTPPEDALAYVMGMYSKENGTDIYKFAMAVDTKSFMEKDDNGTWHFIENEKVNLSNTIVHEMMHAFMDDYTRFGMTNNEDGFPDWFTEGLAVTVENPYQYRSYGLQTMSNANPADWNKDLERFVNEVSYSATSVENRYKWKKGQNVDDNYELNQSNSSKNGYSAYVSGYLAVVYLGYLTAMYNGESDVEVSEDYVDVTLIRSGVSQILSWIHEGDSLDTIIKRISTPTTSDDSGTARFNSTADFENRFIQGAGEGDYVFCNDDNSMDRLGSSAFTAAYLNFLEKTCSDHGDGYDNTKLANGSLLCNDKDDQHKQEFINWNTETSNPLYKMTDDPGAGGFVASTADDSYAYDQTGGRTIDHKDNDNNNVAEFPDENSGAGVAASVPSPAAEPSAVTVSEASAGAANPDTPVSEPAAEPAAEPSAEPVPDPVSINDTPAEDIPPVAGIDPVPQLTDELLLAGGVDLTILPHEEDAIVPDNEMIVTEPAPVAEPSGDGGNDGVGDAASPESEPESAPEDNGGSDEG